MPFFLTDVRTANGTFANMGATAGDWTYVAPGAAIFSQLFVTVTGFGAGQRVTVDGHIGTLSTRTIEAVGADALVTIGAEGRVFNLDRGFEAALWVSDTATVVNRGAIEGATGILVTGGVEILNSGTIAGNGPGGVIPGNGPGVPVAAAGIILRDASAGPLETEIVNTGEIAGTANRGPSFTGRTFAILSVDEAGVGQETRVENHGRLVGEVRLGLLQDVLVNIGTVTGLVNMGAGDDRVENGGSLLRSLDLDLGADVYIGRGTGSVWGVIDGDSGSDTMTGGWGDDSLRGGNDADLLRGRGGDDTLNGEQGVDRLSGGAGADVFVWSSAFHSGSGALAADVVTDMQRGVDLIDLSAIDARIDQPGNQAFTFVGTGSLAGGAGRLRYDPATGLVQGSTDADAAAEFTVAVQNRPVLAATDFLL